MSRALPVASTLVLLAACGGTNTPDPFTIGLTVRYQTGQEDLLDGRDVKLVLAPPGAEPTVTYLGTASAGRSLSLPALPVLEAGTRVGLLAEEPGGPKDAWDPERTVAYGDVLLSEAVASGSALDLEVLVPALGEVGTLDTISAGRRRMHAATVMLPDGRVYVFGGLPADDVDGDASNQILVLDGVDSGDTTFDPIATKLPSTKGFWQDNTERDYTGRLTHAASLLPDGRVLVTGGRPLYLEPFAPTDQWLVFDPADESIAEKGKLPIARMEHLSIPFASGSVLLYGGSNNNQISTIANFDVFDADAGRPLGTFYPDAGTGLFRMFGAPLETDVVVCGGDYTVLRADTQDSVPQSGCVRIDPLGDFEPFDDLPVPLSGATMTPLPDGLLVVGGFSQTISDQIDGQILVDVGSAPAEDAVWRWTEQGGWSQVATLEHPRAHHAAVPLADGRVLIVGGDAEGGAHFGEYGSPVRCPELYDPADDSLVAFDCSDTGSGAYTTAVSAPGTDILVVSGYTYANGITVDGLGRYGYTAFGPPLDPP